MPVVFHRRHDADRLPVQDHLGSGIVGRFQQNRIHSCGGFYSRRFRLHHLSPAHLQTFLCDKRIEGHILGFKRRHTIAVLLQDTAQSACQDAFPRI